MEKSRKAFIGFVDEAIAAASSMRHDELLFFYKGIPYPSTGCSPETFKALESFEARRDDVILAGYLKCGTNWLSQILTDLIAISQKKTPGSESSVNAEEEEVFPYLEVGDAEKYERMSKLPSPRFMVTHLCHENLPKSIFQSNAKILLLIRNPKDVATSYYHFSNGLATLPSYETWDDFFTDFMTKKKSCPGCEKHSQTFFGIPLNEEQLQLVVERSSFQSMKKNSDKTHGSLGNILFRKGGVSDWKNLFTEDQSKKMDKAFEEHIAGTKLGKKLKYDLYCKA